MSNRIPKINRHLQRTLGEILLTEVDIPDGAIVTISHVDTTSNLRFSTIWLYISPTEKAAATLEMLVPQMYDIQGSLNRALEFRPMPRIRFKHDNGSEHAVNIDAKLREI